jgi:hypothetical protein
MTIAEKENGQSGNRALMKWGQSESRARAEQERSKKGERKEQSYRWVKAGMKWGRIIKEQGRSKHRAWTEHGQSCDGAETEQRGSRNGR